MKFRVAVNASIYDGRPTGLGVYTFNLVRALAQLPINLETFVSTPECFPRSIVIGRSGQPSLGLRGHLRRLLWTQTGLRRLCRRLKADILLNPVPEGLIGSCIPQITVVHDVIPLLFPRDYPRHQWYFRHYIPLVLRSSAVVVAVSERTRLDVIERYRLPRDSVMVIPAGVDHRLYTPGINATSVVSRFHLDHYVLYAGSLSPHKNLERLVLAFARLQDSVTLAVAGYRDPRYWPRLARLAARSGVSDRVRFLGYVTDGELAALYAGARAVVVPSLYEGFGLPVLEAMACGAPVIASSAGAVPEVAGEAALLVDPYDEAGWATAIQRVLDDRELALRLRSQGIARAQQFTWEAAAERMLEVINAVLYRTSMGTLCEHVSGT